MKYVTRLCAAALTFAVGVNAAALAAPSGPPKPPKPLPRAFGRGNVYFHPTAYAPYTFADTVVRVRFDFPRGIVYGDETATIRPKRGGLRSVPFNTLGIRYRSVSVNGKPAAYTIDARRELMNVRLNRPAAAGARLAIEFKYSAQPQRGIYFIRSDKGYPHETPEIWSQGEMIDNRRWFPTWDEPNQKTPSELIVTVPRGWTVVANGYLKSHTHARSTDTWDWNAPHPKSTYLIAFAAGPLSEHKTSLGSLPVNSYVQPRYANLNALCFGNTKDIVAYFQKIIGVKFPWEKYDQTTAERFTYGGMENASATIQTSLALHPPIENFERPCDGLVAHELAHQWWGDDVSLSDWSNTWINEGFATYFQELWSEHHFGEPDFEYERYNAQQAYFRETKNYYRPIVDYVYNDPLDLFDASGYPRPGQALHMLRYMFGDQKFFGALRYYLDEYQYKNADTHQFFAAIQKSLGTNLDWFMNEWFYRASYPHYYVTSRYNAGDKTLTLDVTQKNHDGKPFRMPIVIEAFVNGRVSRVRPTIDRNHQVVTMTGIAASPQMILFDPNNNVLRKLTFVKTVGELTYQAAHAAHVGDREWALERLSQETGAAKSAAIAAIGRIAAHDAFYGVRADAVADAAKLRDPATVLAGMHDPDKRVVIASAAAAASLKEANGAVDARLRALSADADPLLTSAALASLGALKAPGAYAFLVAALNRPSFRAADASGALTGLGGLGDMRAFALAKARTAYGTPEQERSAAIIAMTQLAVHAKKPALAEPTLLELAQHDPLIGTRLAATRALGMLAQASAIPTLRRIEANDSQQAVQNAAYSAILDIKDGAAMQAYEAKLAAYNARRKVRIRKNPQHP